MRPSITLAAALLFSGAAASYGGIVSLNGITVQATSTIFSAGGNATASSMSGTDAVLAAQFSAQAGRELLITGVSGLTSPAGFIPISVGADGTTDYSTSETGVNRISGITAAGRSMFLTGVFLADSLPGSAPSSLSYGSNSAYQLSSYSPLLGQVFFIGDGLTGNGSGSAQKFYVPDGATRLYLGFVDGWGFSGTPGYYNDNSGSLTFSATLSGNTGGSVGETPEPATYALLGAGLIGFAIRRKTKKEA